MCKHVCYQLVWLKVRCIIREKCDLLGDLFIRAIKKSLDKKYQRINDYQIQYYRCGTLKTVSVIIKCHYANVVVKSLFQFKQNNTFNMVGVGEHINRLNFFYRVFF